MKKYTRTNCQIAIYKSEKQKVKNYLIVCPHCFQCELENRLGQSAKMKLAQEKMGDYGYNAI